MKRLLVLIPLVLLLAVGTALVWLLATPSGLSWALDRALQRAGLELNVAAIGGRALGPIQFRDARLRGPRFTLSIDDLRVDHRPARLFNGEIRISALAASGVRFERHGPGDGTPPDIILPLALRIDDALIDGLSVYIDDRAPVAVERIRLAAQASRGGVRLDRFEAHAPEGQIDASGRIGWPAQGGAIDLDVAWQWAVPGLTSRLDARGTVGGTWERITANQEVNAPVGGVFEGAVWNVFGGETRWEGQLDFEQVALDSMVDTALPLLVAGQLSATGEGARVWLSHRLDLTDPMFGVWHAVGDVEIDDGQLEFTALELRESGDDGGRLHGQGTLTVDAAMARGFELALDMQASGLRWSLAGEPTLRVPQAEVQWSGHPQDYRLAVDGEVEVLEFPPAQLQADGYGTSESFHAETIAAQWLDGHWDGQATVEWAGDIEWTALLHAEGVDPSPLMAEWPGSLNADIALRGGERALGHDVHAAVTALEGELRGHRVEGEVVGGFVADSWHIERADVRIDEAHLLAEGSADDVLALSFELDLPDLATLDPDARGRIQARGRIEGDRAAPRFSGTFSGAGLQRGELSAVSAEGSFDIDLGAVAPWELDLRLDDLQAGEEMRLDQVSVTGRGDAEDHQLSLEAVGDALDDVRLDASGEWDGETWRGQLRRGQLGYEPIGVWAQRGDAPATVSAAGARLGPWCWDSGGAEACFNAASDDWQSWDIDAELSNFDTAPVLSGVDGLDLEGRIGGQLQIVWDGGLGAVNGELESTGGRLGYRRPDGSDGELLYERIAVRVERGADLLIELDAALGATGSASGRLELAGWTPERPPASQPVSGRFEANLIDLDFLPALFPDVVEPSGRLVATLGVSATAGAPRLEGEMRLVDGTAVLPRLGIELRDVRLALIPGDDDGFEITVAAGSGDGEITLNGVLRGDSASELGGEVTVTGSRFELVRLPGTHVIVSPDMRIDVRPRAAHATGSVLVDEADIVFGGGSRVVTSPDVVIIGEAAAEAEDVVGDPWRITTDLRIDLGPEVHVRGIGFTGRLAGGVVLREDPTTGGRADGEIRVAEGRYAAYGQTLDIREGRIIFTDDPLDNPRLDLAAQRMVADTLVGVRVGGRVQAPVLRLFSEPPMEEREVLAMLAFGRPLVTLSREEGEDLARTAAETGGGNGVASRVASYFGIRQIDLDPTPGQQAVVVGSQLSTRLYVGYAVGLLDNANALRVRYRLTDRWALQTDIGAQGGGDLIYSIER